ncbi:MAG TPA: DUF2007 domain-containing protein [Verrucomicrobiae bacterium]|jgi:hypothetical protein
MKVIFASTDTARVCIAQSILQTAGIPFEVRNDAISRAIPGAAFTPELWILHDEDYEQAQELLSGLLSECARDVSISDAANTRQERQFQVDATAAVLAARLKRWAETGGFVCIRESAQHWKFHRGSNWKAFFSSDFRKSPTDVEVSIEAGTPLSVRCIWHTEVPLTPAMPKDAVQIGWGLDELVEQLRS